MNEGEKQRYHEQGFVHIPAFFDREEINAIVRECRAIFAKQINRVGIQVGSDVEPDSSEFLSAMAQFFKQDPSSFMYCGKQVQHLISLHRLSLDQRIEKGLRELGLTFPNISTRPVLFFNAEQLATKEVYWRVGAHQDWRSMQGSLDAAVVWLPLVDIDEALGALQVVPGSHKRGLISDRVEDGFGLVSGFTDEQFVSLPVSVGDVVFFSSFLVHRSGTNSTDRIRWSCHFRYNNLDEETFVLRGYPHNYIYRPQDELITPDFPKPEQVLHALGGMPVVH